MLAGCNGLFGVLALLHGRIQRGGYGDAEVCVAPGGRGEVVFGIPPSREIRRVSSLANRVPRKRVPAELCWARWSLARLLGAI